MTNLEKFMFYLKDLESPSHFIRWNYFYTISSALARKVWIDDFPTYPNLYIIFVGPPSVGKSLPAVKSTELMRSLQELQGDQVRQLINISPDSTTLEALFRELSNSTRCVVLPDGKKYSHASMSFCLEEELALLFRDKSNDLVNFLTAGYNCGNFNRTTKHQGNDRIANMCINLLGCCTVDWIRDNVSSGMIAQGFTSRVIFIYGEKVRHHTHKIAFSSEQIHAWAEVAEHLRKVSKLAGRITISPEAEEWRANWAQTKKRIQLNPDRKLEYYYGRKMIHMYKLAIVKHFCERTDMVLTVEDFMEAEKELELIEVDMHKAMASTGENPLNKIAEAIKTTLRLKGPQTNKRILIDHYYLGDEEQQAKALQFLQTTGQITCYQDGQNLKYQTVNAEEPSGT